MLCRTEPKGSINHEIVNQVSHMHRFTSLMLIRTEVLNVWSGFVNVNLSG